jgi:hypothetical protein
MKKTVIVLLIALFNIALATAQCPEDMDWKWYDPTNTNWNVYPENAQTFVGAGSPFENAIGSIVPIADALDYKIEDGWILLRKDFGCPSKQNKYPYFILYNKYRAILRIFVFNNITTLVSGTKISLVHNDFDEHRGGSLNYTKPLAWAADQYPVSTAELQDAGVAAGIRANQGTWLFAEFVIAYDPNTPNIRNKFTFYFDAIIENSISLKGTSTSIFEYTNATSVQIASEKSKKCETLTCKTGKFLGSAAKILAPVPNGKDFKTGLEDFATGLPGEADKDGGFWSSLAYEVSAFAKSDAVGILTSLTGTSKVVGYASKLFDFFTGQQSTQASIPQSNQFSPTGMRTDISLSGTMTTDLQAFEIVLQIPGVDYTASGNYPYYNCPLGIATLLNTVEIKRKKVIPFRDPNDQHCSKAKDFTYAFYSYQLNEFPVLAVNGASTLNPQKVEVALVTEVADYPMADIHAGAYKFFDSDDKPIVKLKCDQQSQTKFFINPFYQFFKNKRYEVMSLRDTMRSDSSGIDTVITVTTPFVNINESKGLALTVPLKSRLVGIKVRCVFDAGPGKNPVMFIQTFKCRISDDWSDDIPYPFTQAQQIPDFQIVDDKTISSSFTLTTSNFIETRNNVTINNTSSTGGEVIFASQGVVELKPGFHAFAGSKFTAKAINHNPVPPVNTIEILTVCDESVQNAYLVSNRESDTTIEEHTLSEELTISPNPSSTGTIFFNQEVYGKGKIYNVSGQLVQELNLNGSNINIAEHVQNGLYFFHIEQKDHPLIIKKLLLNR